MSLTACALCWDEPCPGCKNPDCPYFDVPSLEAQAHASKIKQLEQKVIHAACCWRELPVGGANAEKMLINAVDAYEEALRGG